MNVNSLWWVILLCGAGTFLLRLLPMRWQQRNGDADLQPRLRGALQALGPAAIGALLVVSLWPQLQAGLTSPLPVLRLTAGVAAILLTRKVAGGVAIPTLAGVLAYGICAWLTA